MSIRFLSSLLLLFTGINLCLSQNSSEDSNYVESGFKAPAIPKGFEIRKQTLLDISKKIENENSEEIISHAKKVSSEAMLARDTVNLLEAYKILSKVYHYKEDTKQRDHYEVLIQKLAVAYGLHMDNGLAVLSKSSYHIAAIYDELQLLEDLQGKFTFAAVSSPAFANKFTRNFSALPEVVYALRDDGNYEPPEIRFNQEAVYWVKLKVTGQSTQSGNYLFQVAQSWSGSWDKVDLYTQTVENSIEHFRFGLNLSPIEKDFKYNHNLFELALEKNEVKTLYLRLEGNRKGNSLFWRPNFMTLMLMDAEHFLENDGYYHIPDSIVHVHDVSQPRRLNHILHSLNFIDDPGERYNLDFVALNWEKLDPKFPYQLAARKRSVAQWARLRIINKAKSTGTHSFMLPEVWDDIEFYVPDSNDTYKKYITGSNIPDDEKAVPGLYNIVHVNAGYNDTLVMYIKFKINKLFPGSSTILNEFEVFHFDEYQLWRDHNKQYLPYYLMVGILLIQFLYYLINYLINKERTHLYLMVLCFGIFLYMFNHSNIFRQFPANQAIFSLGTSLGLIGLFKYTETFLGLRTIARWLRIFNNSVFCIMLASLLAMVGNVCYHYFFEQRAASDELERLHYVNLLVTLFVLITLLIQAIYVTIKRLRYARFFLFFYVLIVIPLFGDQILPSSWQPDQKIAVSYAILTLSFLGLMFITAFRLKHLRKDQADKEKAQASERAKHQFLANMSHEIRTPMNAIKGMTDILIRRNPKDDQREYLNSIKQSSDSLLIIVNDILDISKIEAGKIELVHEPFSLIDLVDHVHTLMQFKAEEKGLELRKDIPADQIYVKGDATRLRQILINLIGNAIKFTENGLVTTTLKYKKNEDILNLHFTVSDTGIGIDKDHLEKIFNSFEQAYSDTSRKFGGTGLGLSISRKLVELQNGKIWVESEKGKGSEFHFTIPYETAEITEQDTKAESPDNPVAAQLKGIRILLVEDNQYNIIVAQEELEDAIEDARVEVAVNGAIAVEKLKSQAFDVILMDVQMPVMNGYEATKAIRVLDNEKARIPIIAMTANVLKEEVDLCFQAGMDDYIWKPFDTNELIQKIYSLKSKMS